MSDYWRMTMACWLAILGYNFVHGIGEIIAERFYDDPPGLACFADANHDGKQVCIPGEVRDAKG